MDSAQLWAITPAVLSVAAVMLAVAWIKPRTTKKEDQ